MTDKISQTSETFLGSLLGVGPGRGIALVFIFSAVFLWVTSIYAFVNPRVRNLEIEVPDAIPDKAEEEEENIVKEEDAKKEAVS